MKLKQDIINFIKSNKITYVFKHDKQEYQGYNIYETKETEYEIFKKTLMFDNGYALYIGETDRDLNSNFTYLCCVDNNGDIIHYSDYGYSYHSVDKNQIFSKIIDDFNEKEYEKIIEKQKNIKYNNINNEIRKILSEYFNSKNAEYDKEYKYDNYKDIAKEYYVTENNGREIINPISQFNTQFSTKIISMKNLEDNEFKKQVIDHFKDDIETKYKNYYCGLKALKDYKNELKTNPYLAKEKKIMDILLNDNYKSFRIYHTLPNGSTCEFIYKKDMAKYKDVKSQIVDSNQLYNIPICAIDKIMYRKDVLFDKDDYKDKPYNLKDLALKYAECTQDTLIDEIAKAFNDDKEVMTKLFEVDKSSFTLLSPTLKKEPDFVYNLIKNHYKKDNYYSRANIFDNIPKELYQNKDFVKKTLKCFEKDKGLSYWDLTYKDSARFYDNIEPEACDKEVLIELINNSFYHFCEMIPKIGISILDDKDILKNIGQKNTDRFFLETTLPLITNKKKLLTILNLEEVPCEMYHLNDNILLDRNFVITLLGSEDVRPLGENSHLIDIYKDDKEIMDLILRRCKECDTEHYLRHYLKDTGLFDEYGNIIDENKYNSIVLELSEINIGFLNELKGPNTKTYLFNFMQDKIFGAEKVYLKENTSDMGYSFNFNNGNLNLILEDCYGQLAIRIDDKYNHETKIFDAANIMPEIKEFMETEINIDFGGDPFDIKTLKKIFINRKHKEDILSFRWPKEEEIER